MLKSPFSQKIEGKTIKSSFKVNINLSLTSQKASSEIDNATATNFSFFDY